MAATPVNVARAEARARALVEAPWRSVAPLGNPPRRWFLMGDPQTGFARFAGYLDAAGLLGEDGWLSPGLGLVSMGDHFDYGHGDPAATGLEGMAILRWLAAHPPDQVVILAGNHDLARVAELAGVSDEDFASARTLARDRTVSDHDFAAAHPGLPLRGLVARDYSAFSEAQRRLVQGLLLAGRMVLGATAQGLEGTEILLTHAGFTEREAEILGLTENARPAEIAVALADRLAAAVARCRPYWDAGETAALDLGRLYVPGDATAEGGGMLYHRPGRREDAPFEDPASWSWNDQRPRRFDPRRLPEGLVQACGHSGHSGCVDRLGSWVAPRAREAGPGRVRTLTRKGERVHYDLGIRTAVPGEATLYLLDPEMSKSPESIAFMQVAAVSGVHSR